jgi:FkbM family methyltransferase
MMIEPASDHFRTNPPARSFRRRLEEAAEMLQFGWARGGTWRDSVRLFHYLALKPSLAFRGWSHNSPERIISFSVKATGRACFKVCVHDNGLEAGTIAEFFSSGSRIVPPEMPPLRPKVIYDVGANIGIASLRFALEYPDARFYGFEPVPTNYQVCALNFQNLRKAEAYPWAVGSRTEVTTFECNEDPRGGHLQATPGNPHLQPKQRIDVQVVSIADLVQVRKLEPPEFLKIDVEGAEMEVLKGMGEAVGSVKRMFVETHSPTLKEECLNWLREHGFKIWPSQDPTALWGDRD